MATDAEITLLRRMIAEDTEEVYTNVELGTRLDAAADPKHTRISWEIWTEKAARYTSLVDVSEGGSSRSMGQLQQKAIEMVKLFKGQLDAAEPPPEPLTGVTRLHKLRR